MAYKQMDLFGNEACVHPHPFVTVVYSSVDGVMTQCTLCQAYEPRSGPRVKYSY